jgi:hypothetical protein
LNDFAIKDSGKREEFDSGMVRDTEDGKLDYSLIFDGPMLKRWAAHLTKGAVKYSPRNWMKASGPEEEERFRRSLLRHLVAYLDGETDEDHAAAIFFNVNGIEYVRDQLNQPIKKRKGWDYLLPLHLPEFSGGIVREPPKVKCSSPGYTKCSPCTGCVEAGCCLYGEDFSP